MEADASLVGQMLNHFRVDAKLGEGGMGVVYLATDERLRREVALKVLPSALTGDDERRRRFLREARSAAAVSHPNIAAVHDIGEARGHVYIAMELVHGVTLREKMAPGLSHNEALRIAREVARGLAKAHERGVVHRDLKPENVMITPEGGVKILDFGLAKLSEDESRRAVEPGTASTASQLTVAGRVLGTPAYMFPEQTEARGEVDARSDLFSFGVMFYEMLSGVRPFRGPTAIAILYGVVHGEPEPLQNVAKEVPPAVVAVVARCLRKDREERFGSARELLAELGGDAGSVTPDAASGRALPTPSASTESAVGFAIESTVAVDAANVGNGRVAAAARAPAPARASRRGLVLVLALVVVVGALAAVQVWRHAGPRATAGASASASADDGMPRSSNPEAQRLFEEAMRSSHDGTVQDLPLLQNVVAIDPGFAGAWFRLWYFRSGLLGDKDERTVEAHRHLVALQSTLAPRDRVLYRAVQSADSRRATLDGYLTAHPDDDLGWELRIDGQSLISEPETIDRAIAADPGYTELLAAKSALLLAQRKPEEAERVASGCLDQVHGAVSCLQARAEATSTLGRCVAAESDVRRVLDLLPDLGPSLRPELAALVAANGAPVAAVREALGPDGAKGFTDNQFIPEVLVPLYVGDLAEAIRVAKEASSRVPSSAGQQEHLLPVLTLVEVYGETGDVLEAGHAAAAYLDRRAAWDDPPHFDSGLLFWAALRSGDLTAAAADRLFEAERAAAQAGGVPPGPAWLDAYGGAATRAEADRALARLDPVRDTEPERYSSRLYGTILALAGRPQEARRYFDPFLIGCRAQFTNPIGTARTRVLLGQMDEAEGDRAGACAEYAKILARWPSPKPKSVSVDAARARTKALGCE